MPLQVLPLERKAEKLNPKMYKLFGILIMSFNIRKNPLPLKFLIERLFPELTRKSAKKLALQQDLSLVVMKRRKMIKLKKTLKKQKKKLKKRQYKFHFLYVHINAVASKLSSPFITLENLHLLESELAGFACRGLSAFVSVSTIINFVMSVPCPPSSG